MRVVPDAAAMLGMPFEQQLVGVQAAQDVLGQVGAVDTQHERTPVALTVEIVAGCGHGVGGGGLRQILLVDAQHERRHLGAPATMPDRGAIDGRPHNLLGAAAKGVSQASEEKPTTSAASSPCTTARVTSSGRWRRYSGWHQGVWR